MRFLIFFYFLMFSSGLSAQEKQTLVGRWKVVAIHDGEMYMDFVKDSAALTGPLKTPEDSAMLLELLSITAAAYGEVEMIFGQYGTFEERYNGNPDATGTYVMETNGKNLTTKIKRRGKVVTQRMEFVFFRHQLRLTYLDDKEKTLVLTLERVP